MIELRPYQNNIIKEIKKNLKYISICIQSACGSGKSIIEGMIAANATMKKNRVLFLVHRKELCNQIEQTFKMCNVDFHYCNISMVQTVTRNLDKEPPPIIIMTDENHHCLAASYTRIYDTFPDAIKLGFTATPIRLGGKGLGTIYNILIKGPEIDWLIENNFLAPFKLFSKKLVDISELHTQNGDYKQNEVHELMEKNIIYGETIKNYTELANGKKTIVYCSSIASSIATVEEFNNNGFKAIHLDGTTPKKEREKCVEDFRNNKIQILSNVDLFGEGFDVPDCECVILLRPTKSLSLYIQQSMRSMRYKEGKEAIIIDHVGNCFEHGLPNYEHPWSLEDWPKRKKGEKEVKIKECKQCFAIVSVNTKICPNCGYVFEVKEKEKDVEVKDIILEEVTQENILRNKPYYYYENIRTLKELILFSKAKGYKTGWLYHKIEERKDLLEMTFEDFKTIQKENGYKFQWVIHKATEYKIEIPEQYKVTRRYANG
jgi:superfamily II DNA or RNA helicase